VINGVGSAEPPRKHKFKFIGLNNVISLESTDDITFSLKVMAVAYSRLVLELSGSPFEVFGATSAADIGSMRVFCGHRRSSPA
ncbi:MAG: hypothetical protein ACRD3W_05785, partial [Terriglobales bacterium]